MKRESAMTVAQRIGLLKSRLAKITIRQMSQEEIQKRTEEEENRLKEVLDRRAFEPERWPEFSP